MHNADTLYGRTLLYTILYTYLKYKLFKNITILKNIKFGPITYLYKSNYHNLKHRHETIILILSV